jgi:hypothetical protein
MKSVVLPMLLVSTVVSFACGSHSPQASQRDAGGGSLDSNEGYAETSMPVVDAKRTTGVTDLGFEAPGRVTLPDASNDKQAQPKDAASPYCRSGIANPAPMVAAVISASPAPTPAGGALVAGTYYLTSWTYYGANESCKLYSYGWTMVVTPSAGSTGYLQETLHIDFGYMTSDEMHASTYVVSDTSLDMSPCQGDFGYDLRSYTATANEIVVFPIRYENCGTTVQVFTKQ